MLITEIMPVLLALIVIIPVLLAFNFVLICAIMFILKRVKKKRKRNKIFNYSDVAVK